jgi:electron transfer flavoprotein beta subunit
LKLAVCVKHAVDETELKVDPSGKPLLSGAAGKMSTFDKNAVEEALRLKSANGGEIVVFTVGSPDAKKSVKEALAMGADKGVVVSADVSVVDTLRTAELLGAAIRRGGPFDIVLCSEGSSDTYTGQVPPAIAELLQVPYVGYARKIETSGEVAKLERSLEDSVETVEASVPLVVSVVSEINEPRYPTLIQIMQASKKPIEELKEEDLGVPKPPSSPSVVSMSAQTSNRKRVMIDGTPDEAAAKLVEALVKEGVLGR